MKPTFPSPPRLTIKPESTLPTVAPADNIINGSVTLIFWVSTVVVVPLTVKLPDTVKFPPAVKLFEPKLTVPPESVIVPVPSVKVEPTTAVVAATWPAVPYITAFSFTTVPN